MPYQTTRLRLVRELLDRRRTSCRRWREVRGQLELVAQRASAQSIRRSKADRVDPRSPLSTQHSALKYSSLRQLRTRRVWQYLDVKPRCEEQTTSPESIARFQQQTCLNVRHPLYITDLILGGVQKTCLRTYYSRGYSTLGRRTEGK